jgi:hypothetical protein
MITVSLKFISAGQGAHWRDAMLWFKEGNVFFAYLKAHAFVGEDPVSREKDSTRIFLRELDSNPYIAEHEARDRRSAASPPTTLILAPTIV